MHFSSLLFVLKPRTLLNSICLIKLGEISTVDAKVVLARIGCSRDALALLVDQKLAMAFGAATPTFYFGTGTATA